MHLLSFLGWSLVIAGSSLTATASPLGNLTEPEIIVTASFPESNPFGHVVNGERNTILLLVENKSDRNVTLRNVAGSFHNAETNNLIKNTSSLSYGMRLIEGTKLQIPYTFFSEYKPGDIKLNIWLEHTVDDELYRVTAYDSIVTVVEPEISFFDFKLISTYLVASAICGGLLYFAYLTFFPQSKGKRKSKTAVSAPVGSVTATGAGGYQEEWIPEHHLRKGRGDKRKSELAAASSADETSGAELSNTEKSGSERKRRAKGKK